MGNKTRVLTLLLIAVLIASFAVFVRAQTNTIDSIVKPSAPEFSIRIVSHPYDVPQTTKTTTTVDQYTGKVTTITDTSPGYHVENKSIEVTIKNQPFTPFKLSSYQRCSFDMDHYVYYIVNESITVNHYFVVQVKGHFGNDSDWRSESGYFLQSGSENTIKNVILNLDKYPSDAVLDFRILSATGYLSAYFFKNYDAIKFFGQESDWSSIHMLNLADNVETVLSNTSPINPNPQPTAQNQTLVEPTQTSKTEPTQARTDATNQALLQGTAAFGVSWQNIAIAVLCITAGLATALAFMSKRRGTKASGTA